jgi:L-seryl-tRNA(Ser) seleniumtransferase
MLGLTKASIEKRAKALVENLSDSPQVKATVVEGHSAVGGGSGPNVHPPTALLAIHHKSLNAQEVERQLRLSSPPVVARIADDRVLLDLRTVDPNEEGQLLNALRSLN